MNFYTLPNICEISPDGPSPSCHLGDGFTDLVVVNECSRLQMHSHIQRNFNFKDQVSFLVMSEILMHTEAVTHPIAHFADMAAILNSIVLNIYYGMLWGQINLYLPPQHPVIDS